jgi:hypothetical protein
MRKGIGVILLIGALFFLSISLQFVVAQEDNAPSTEIEIVEDGSGGEATPAPEATAPADWKPGTDSGNTDPFTNLIDPKGKITVTTPPPTLTPPPTQTPPPETDTGDGEIVPEETPEPVVDSTTAPVVVPTPPPVKPKDDNKIAEGLFKYTGVLWNGYEHIAIITSSGNTSYIAKSGDELKEGFVVLYVDDKEVILVKEGQKSTLKIQEVDKK